MFGWSKKKETKKRERRENNSEENEFGIKIDKGPSDKQLEAELKALTGVNELPEDEINLNEGEEDVESELLRLIGGGKGRTKPIKSSAPNEGLGNVAGDISADIEEIGDEDVEVDENDPDLLGELMELTESENPLENEPEPESDPESEETSGPGESDIISTLKERLKLYKTAEAKAKENNESSRARRFNRGIKTLEELIKKAKAGKEVSPSDIPPVIALNLKPPPPPMQEVSMNENEINGGENELGSTEEMEEKPYKPNSAEALEVDVLTTLMERLKLYQTAEAKAKESNEITRARRFNRGIKTLEGLIRQAKAGKPVAPGDIPPVVALNLKPAPPVVTQLEQDSEENLDYNEEKVEIEMDNINLSPVPSRETDSKDQPERNVMDVLSERLEMYEKAEAKAKESGESTRARRFGRGIKTIQDLIKQATAGKPISVSDIPPPIALNLKPAPPVVVALEEEETKDSEFERDSFVQSSDKSFGSPLKFAAVDDDVDLDEDLEEEEIPETVLDGLKQRLRIYSKLKEKAEEEGDERSMDQNDKNVKIYLNAIRTYKSGGYVDVLSLPTPKGCPPIPIPFQIP